MPGDTCMTATESFSQNAPSQVIPRKRKTKEGEARSLKGKAKAKDEKAKGREERRPVHMRKKG